MITRSIPFLTVFLFCVGSGMSWAQTKSLVDSSSLSLVSGEPSESTNPETTAPAPIRAVVVEEEMLSSVPTLVDEVPAAGVSVSPLPIRATAVAEVALDPSETLTPVNGNQPIAEVEPVGSSQPMVRQQPSAAPRIEMRQKSSRQPRMKKQSHVTAQPITINPRPIASYQEPTLPSRALQTHSSWRSRYELGPGDQLNFGLHGKPKLKKLKVPIAPDGTVSFLQAKQIDVRGKTIDELRSQMNQLLASYHREAKVIITPAKLGSKRYTILGEVKKNGAYPLERPTTLLQALAATGGFNLGTSGEDTIELADLRRSFVVRNGNHLPIDMESLYLRGDMTQNMQLEPNDYVYIASKARNEVFVFGAVNRPGPTALENHLTTLGAVAAAGGFGKIAWRDRVLVVRGSMDNPESFVVHLNKVVHGKETDVELRPGDIVYVHTRPWAYAAKILDTAISAYINGSVAGILADEAISVSAGGGL